LKVEKLFENGKTDIVQR